MVVASSALQSENKSYSFLLQVVGPIYDNITTIKKSVTIHSHSEEPHKLQSHVQTSYKYESNDYLFHRYENHGCIQKS